MKRWLARLVCLSTLTLPAFAQGDGWTPWRETASELNGCGDCNFNGTWGLHNAVVGDLGVRLSMQSMNLSCCYAGGSIEFSVPSSWGGLAQDGPPSLIKVRPKIIGIATRGGVVFRNFHASADLDCPPPTGSGTVHGFLGPGSNLWQCAPCSGTYGVTVYVGNGLGEHVLQVVRDQGPAIRGVSSGGAYTPHIAFTGAPGRPASGGQPGFEVRVEGAPAGARAMLAFAPEEGQLARSLLYGFNYCVVPPPIGMPMSVEWYLGSHAPYFDWASRDGIVLSAVIVQPDGTARVDLSPNTRLGLFLALYAGRSFRLQWAVARNSLPCFVPTELMTTEFLRSSVPCDG